MTKWFPWLLVVLLFAACGEESTGDDDSSVGDDDDTVDTLYEVPLAPDSPWPKFRRNARQNGRTHLSPAVHDDSVPWVFETGKGIFSTPVIDGEGNVYVGSADRFMYALSPEGEQLWSYETDEIIDSSGLLDDRGHLYFGSGDGFVRALDVAVIVVVDAVGARGARTVLVSLANVDDEVIRNARVIDRLRTDNPTGQHSGQVETVGGHVGHERFLLRVGIARACGISAVTTTAGDQAQYGDDSQRGKVRPPTLHEFILLLSILEPSVAAS